MTKGRPAQTPGGPNVLLVQEVRALKALAAESAGFSCGARHFEKLHALQQRKSAVHCNVVWILPEIVFSAE